MLPTEKQLSSKATTDSFDEIYTNFDLSVNEEYLTSNGYPFDYPTRWLNDPSMNKRIAIRRLDVTPSSHTFKLRVTAKVNEGSDYEDEPNGLNGDVYDYTGQIDVTYADNLVKVLSHLCNTFSYQAETNQNVRGGLQYYYDQDNNKLQLWFVNSSGMMCDFAIKDWRYPADDVNIEEFLKFLNQKQPFGALRVNLETETIRVKEFTEVWNRDIVYFHTTFSTSRRKFVGLRGDFYHTPTLLYPPPTNESTFYVRFTSDGMKSILIRYCNFNIQLCYIVNYRKATIL